MDPQVEIQDWEFLPSPTKNPNPVQTLDSVSEDGAIDSNYFSLNPIHKSESEDPDTDLNPSWIDPDSESLFQRNARSFTSDSSDEMEGDVKKEDEVVGNEKSRLGNEGTTWWKVKFEILKVWVMRTRPIWAVSIMAVAVGIAVVGRRLYRMRSKARNVNMKIVLDDKKVVSQFMTRAARLNEAFSAVKRVPLIRPSLPAAGNVASWPIMSSLR